MDFILTKSDLLVIGDKSYQYQISVKDDNNLEISIKKMNNESFYKYSFTLNQLKSKSALFFNNTKMNEIYEKILIKIEKRQINLIEYDEDSNLHFIFYFTIDEEKCQTIFKLPKFTNKKFEVNFIEELRINEATEEDITIILDFIKELAEYEKSLSSVKISEKNLIKNIFSVNSTVECKIVYYNGIPVGFFVYFFSFSTWVGRGLFLDDLYIKPEYRAKGIGKNIMAYLAKYAIVNDCKRFEWNCLDWNEPSIEFYKSLGAIPMDEWTTYRLQEKNLQILASHQYLDSCFE